MVKNEIQEQRMKEYFIEATKEILRGEGLKAVSVRNIAERAGYSYATLYNYFKDVKMLVFECVKDFQEEGLVFIEKETAKSESGIQNILDISLAFGKFFVEYPGIFELFYLEKMSPAGPNSNSANMVYEFYKTAIWPAWQKLIELKIFTKGEVEFKIRQANFLITGILLFYLNRNIPAAWNEYEKTIREQMQGVISASYKTTN